MLVSDVELSWLNTWRFLFFLRCLEMVVIQNNIVDRELPVKYDPYNMWDILILKKNIHYLNCSLTDCNIFYPLALVTLWGKRWLLTLMVMYQWQGLSEVN